MTTSHKLVPLLAAMSVVMLMSGCASSQKMSDEDKSRIKTARIQNTVQKGQVFLLAPGGASAALMFGAVGGAASAGSISDAQTAFNDYLAKNAISIEAIAREEVERAVKASGKLAITTETDPATPSIQISVPQYGFGVTHLLSSNVVPVLQIKCDMVDGSGKVIWSASDRMLPSIASPMDATAWAQLANDPKLIEAQLRKASKFLADKLVKEL